MLELQAEKTFRGTWDEVVSHRDEIPSNAIIELKVYAVKSETDENVGDFGGKTIGEAYGHLFGNSSFGPSDLAERTEDYLIQSGFGESPNRCDSNQ
ncbi:MAG: hypothetical protein M3Y56_08000 [Armatimonadota bacterium]|nr:hypothetical protein [Armatimonadota bacterium]